MKELIKNKLFIVSAPSGSGKTTVMREIFDNEVLSFTTRTQRENEENGIDYIFLTVDDFTDKLSKAELAEHTLYSGNYYGLTMEELENKLSRGHAFVVVDYAGMDQLKKIYPYCVTIFIESTKEDCIKNMLDRGDSLTSIRKRMVTYDAEIANQVHYDYKVKNKRGFLPETVNIITSIVEEEIGWDRDKI